MANPTAIAKVRQGCTPHKSGCSCGLRGANFSPRKPVLTNLNFTRDGMRATYSRRAVSKKIEIKNDEKSVIEEEDAAGSDLEIERVRIDPSQLQSMTVKELRELTRRMGVSGKGTKKDLVSALMDSLGVEGNGKGGKSSSELVSPSEEPLKRKGGASAVVEQNLENSEVISETPSKKRSRTKQKSIKATTLEENSVSNVKINKTSVQKETLVVKGAAPRAGLSPTDNSEPWTVLVHKKPQAGWIPYNPKTMRPPPLSKDTRALKILSWNVNGLKALLKSRGFSVRQLAEREDFDVLCLQETKMQEKDVEVIKDTLLDGYTNSFWTCSVSKLGYSGTATISRHNWGARSCALLIILGRRVSLDIAQVVKWRSSPTVEVLPTVCYAASFAGFLVISNHEDRQNHLIDMLVSSHRLATGLLSCV